jgi:transposase InsO family protein
LPSRSFVGVRVSRPSDAQENGSGRVLPDQTVDASIQPSQLLALEALRRPFEFTPYASNDYRAALIEYAMVASMSRTGDCWDHACAETFFATLRAEQVDDERYASSRDAERSIGEYIDGFYNVERLHSHLDYVSPIEFELKAHVTTIAA